MVSTAQSRCIESAMFGRRSLKVGSIRLILSLHFTSYFALLSARRTSAGGPFCSALFHLGDERGSLNRCPRTN
ncbi:hypothetical protein GYMLUDRAFT_45501 [Collybiopsis luxurians FD-317 M1]|uniref:Uncharacterized protein n=1 Tax=Collybiopsis luxurians FD-317 M1 TaxID=944289 RepID=A0A0D0CRN6_9AGAR|nr:hypothetical protein GYMLUDRAFT_45501 [Collybiopsis luxurians FD-317 M1]